MADQTITIVLTGNAAGLETAGKKAEKALAGVSAGAKQAAVSAQDVARVMPQITDVFVSLGSGQSPFTVLLQQGGQLKDMFGGIAPATRAVGAAVSGIVNPFTAGAAAVAALALAYNKGANEAQAYTAALTLSGNAQGATVGMLSNTARGVAEVTGNVGEASAALATFAATGAVPVSMLEQVAAGAIRLARVGGPSVEETAKRFAELGKDPLQASIKLNESTNFLTESVYRQIRSLTDQGRTAEATGVAIKALAQANDIAATQMEARLGLLEKAWGSLKKTIAGVWDGALNIGREQGLQEQLKQAQAQLAAIGESARGGTDATQAEARRQAIRDRIALLQEQVRLEFRAADAKRLEGEQVKALVDWDKTRDQYLSKVEQREQAIAKIREQGRRAGASEAEIAKRVAEAQDKFKDEKGPNRKPGDANAADRIGAKGYADAFNDFTRLAEQASAKTDGLSAAQARLVQYLQSPAYGQHTEAMRQVVLQQGYAAVAAEQQAAAQKEVARIAAESTKAHAAMIETIRKAAEGAEQQVRQYTDEAEAADLAAARNISLKQALEEVAIARLREKQAAMLGNEDAVLAIEREIEARRKLIGLTAGADWRQREDKEREDRIQKEQRAAEQIGQSLSDAIMQGGQSAGELLRNYFRTLILKPIVDAAVNPLASGLQGGLSSLLSGLGGTGYSLDASVAGATGGITSDVILPNLLRGGFAAGGYTGNIGRNRVAGVVHGNEYVFDAASTARIGAGNLEAMRQGGSVGGATVHLSPVINIDARSDATQVATMVGQALQQQQRAMQEQLSSMGLVR
jgi:phage-related minor tail protein